ncbi:MAG: hypothetical protein R2941_11610 [Desulfobacterales bacterium]
MPSQASAMRSRRFDYGGDSGYMGQKPAQMTSVFWEMRKLVDEDTIKAYRKQHMNGI